MAAQFDLFARADVRADLAGIQAPTLIIATTEDRLVPLSHPKDMAARIPGARLTEVGTGHLLPLEQPQEWAKLITSFLDEVGA